LDDLQSYVFDSRREEIFVSAKVSFYFLIYLKHLRIQDITNISKIPRLIARELWRIYLLSCIKCLKPKVVITWIDNSQVFHWLSERCNDSEFMAIQNGARANVEIQKLKIPYSIQHFFCFGKLEEDVYSKLGFKVDHYYPIGSVLGGYYKYRNKNKDKSQYDICVVSSWRGNIGNGLDVQRTMESMRKMDLFLSRYIEEYHLSAAVALRSEANSNDRNIPVYGNEEEYFGRIYGSEVTLVDPVFANGNVYKIMDEGSIVVTFGSTAAREAFGWGKKVLYCDFTGLDFYNDYDQAILFRVDDYDAFKARLNNIRLMPYKEYRAETKDYASYLMNYDPDCPPHLFVRKKIEHYLF